MNAPVRALQDKPVDQDFTKQGHAKTVSCGFGLLKTSQSSPASMSWCSSPSGSVSMWIAFALNAAMSIMDAAQARMRKRRQEYD